VYACVRVSVVACVHACVMEVSVCVEVCVYACVCMRVSIHEYVLAQACMHVRARLCTFVHWTCVGVCKTKTTTCMSK